MVSVFEQVLDEAFAALRAAGVSPEVQSEWQEKYRQAYASKPESVGILNKEIMFVYPYLKPAILEQLYIYATNAEPNDGVIGLSETPTIATDALTLALKHKVENGATYQLHRVSGSFRFKELKKVIVETAVVSSDIAYSKLPLFISQEVTMRGVILSNFYGGTKQFQIYKTGHDKDGNRSFTFFDDLSSMGRPDATDAEFSWSFYVYKFMSEGAETFMLFSPKELSLGQAVVCGVKIQISDKSPFGDTSKIASVKQVILVHSADKDIKQISLKEAEAIREGYSYDSLVLKVRGGYPHPVWFERFLCAWLFSGKYSGFPLHFVWLSEAGGGKTKVMFSLHKQFGELIEPAAIGTLKGLVPNFGGILPDEGYLCKCQRLAFVDEFFSLLRRSNSNAHSPIDAEASLLTALLEHQEYSASSGKHANFKVHPRAKMFFASNMRNYLGFEDMSSIAGHLPNPFMSRLLWYVQTPAHTDFVDHNKARVADNEQDGKDGNLYPLHDPEFVSLCDWFNSFTLRTPSERVDEVYDKYAKTAVPPELMEIYRARYKHHFVLLVDGVAKLNWLLKKREKLEIREEDIVEAEALFATFILSWSPQKVLYSEWVDPKIKANYLPYASAKVLSIVRDQPGVEAKDVKMEYAENILIDLQKMGLLRMEQDSSRVVAWHWFAV